jgi:hypothetical protein
MSLFALPVSVSDLTKLQLGIEFFTNTTEATTEAGQITNPPSTPTVYSYAVQLLANNISLSQVAMAVDSLMFGVTDNVTELTKLATQFLPAQVSHAVANGFNPTVYAAEALGLALAGGNGTSDNFATDFGSLSVAQFASEVGGITGVNTGAIQGFVQNWINFYTANPSATFGMSATLASYGAAFGDAVGAALINPTFNGSLALLTSEVQNALFDNAEGLYKAGIPLMAEGPHLPLQGEAFLIPDAGGAPYGAAIDWAHFAGSAFNYAQFSSPQFGPFAILNAPSTFTLDSEHYSDTFPTGDNVISAAGNGNLFTLIVGNDTGQVGFDGTIVVGYPTVHIVGKGGDIINNVIIPSLVVTPPAHSTGQLVISGSGLLSIGDLSNSAHEGNVTVSVSGGTITEFGFGLALELGVTDAETVDASNGHALYMEEPASVAPGVSGVTVLGSAASFSFLQGSLGGIVSPVTFGNGTKGLSATIVGDDNIIAESGGGGDSVYGDGGADTITLPERVTDATSADFIWFGFDLSASGNSLDQHVLAITDGSDVAYPGFWGATVPTAIPKLFTGISGGTSADMSMVTGFRADFGGNLHVHDHLLFSTAAWNGNSGLVGSAQGDLVGLNGIFLVTPGAAQLSAPWINSGSNSSLKTTDNVLLYAPSDASLQNAQQLAARLHTSFDAVVLPGGGVIGASEDRHILVAYAAGNNVVNLADVDLVNTSASNQSSTANLNVYASDMVHLTGVSLTSLTPDNIHFI